VQQLIQTFTNTNFCLPLSALLSATFCSSHKGPKGEVYSTHTTIEYTDSTHSTIGAATWYYVVGVQMSAGGFAVTPAMLGFKAPPTGAASTGATGAGVGDMVQIPW
jgi:hypothetical protein